MGLRQEKFAKLIQRDMGELFQSHRHEWLAGEFVTISGVQVSPDLGYVKIYLSLFNSKHRQQVMENMELYNRDIRRELAARLKNQVRKIPEIMFFEDDTLDYVDKMDQIFKNLTPPVDPPKEH
jgi:ribosome-binding factor A